MKKTLLLKAMMCLVASFFCVLLPSCVNGEYEMSEEKLDLEVTVFQEGVSLPLGNTEQIRMEDLLEQLDPEVAEYFKQNPSGAYSVGVKGDYDLSENLDFLKDVAGLDAIVLDRNFPFSFVNMDMSGLSFGPYDYPYEQYISELFGPVDFTIPAIAPAPIYVTADMEGYLPSADALKLPTPGAYDFTGCVAEFNNLNVEIDKNFQNDTPIALYDVAQQFGIGIQTYEKFDMSESPLHIEVEFKLPAMVEEVSEIRFGSKSRMKLAVELKDHFFSGGTITPHLKMDLHEVFHMNGVTDDLIEADFVLNNDDNFSAEETYYISTMVVNPGDVSLVNGEVVFKKIIEVCPEITLAMDGLTTTTRLLATHPGGKVNAHVTAEFLDFEIDDVVMSMKPEKVPVKEDIRIDISDIRLPDEISSIQEVTFAPGSGFDFEIKASGLSGISGLGLDIESFDLTFPEGIIVSGADASGKLSVEGGSLLGKTLKRHVEVTALKPGSSSTGKLSFNGNVGVDARAWVSGKDLHTKELLKAGEISLEISVAGNLEMADFKAGFKGYEHRLDVEPYVIEKEVDEEVAKLGAVSVELEGNPVIALDMDLPETSLPITAAADGIKVSFPKMLVFGDDLPEGFDKSTNVLRIEGAIPTEPIVLPVKKLVIEPEKVGEKWMVCGEIGINGGVSINPAVVTKKDLDAITAPDSKVAFRAHVSELKPSTVGIDEYTATLNPETFGFEDIDLSSLPKELVSIGVVELDDVYFNLTAKSSGLEDVLKEADVTFDIEVTLPSVINVEDGKLQNGVLSISGTLDKNGEISIAPLKIESLDLSGIDIWSEDPFKDMNVGISGEVKVKNATVDLAALENADLRLDVYGEIVTAGKEQINISKVTGKVDYQMEPMAQTLDLSELMSALDDEKITASLDVNRFSLRLEVETNLKVPVAATISLTPFKGETAGKVLTPKEPVQLRCPEKSGESAFTRLWISNTEEDMPEGYTFVELNLVDMLKDMPDRVDFTISAGTDPEKDCELVPSEKYILKADYAADLPVEFGDDFRIEFRETIDGLPKELGEILKMGSLAIIGEITSSLPIQLEMKATLLDSEGNAVELAEDAGELMIKPCTPDGAPVRSDVNLLLKIKPGADVSDITSLGLYFKASTKGVAGVPVTKDSFVQAELAALIPEGVTIDLGQYLDTENND